MDKRRKILAGAEHLFQQWQEAQLLRYATRSNAGRRIKSDTFWGIRMSLFERGMSGEEIDEATYQAMEAIQRRVRGEG